MGRVEKEHEIITGQAEAGNVSIGTTDLQNLIADIREALQGIKLNYLRIGWSLKYIRETKLYEKEGFKNINDFAAHYFNLSQSSVSRFINICEEFSVAERPELMERYASFNLSQLIELIPMNEELRKEITSDMTVAQIRELKNPKAKKEQKEMPKNKADAADKPYEISHSSEYVHDVVERDWQVELPRFQNDDERRAWVHNVESWVTWFIEPNVYTEYFKYDFSDGSRLIATKFKDVIHSYDGEVYSDDVHYHMVFSRRFLEKHGDGYLAAYKNHCIHDAIPFEDIISFLRELQNDGSDVVTVEESGNGGEEYVH